MIIDAHVHPTNELLEQLEPFKLLKRLKRFERFSIVAITLNIDYYFSYQNKEVGIWTKDRRLI